MLNEEMMATRYEEGVNIVKNYIRDDKIEKAKAIFEELGDYKDSEDYLQKCVTYLSCQPGQIITMGEYNGKALNWIVLEKKGREVFMFATDVVDERPWNVDRDHSTWSTCSLRRWLNKDFINTAFTMKERMSILLTDVDNISDPRWGKDNGQNTRDKLFIFNKAELDKYFPNETDRALGRWYWLRGHGECLLALQAVYEDGSVYMFGVNKNAEGVGIRPAMRIRLTM